ncbi:spermidine synthase [Inhella sp.]|uniref:spermidine synthase n=1 Tax=Inhella sp. TaxID=1921806 RepID=UPI0035AEDD7A
MSDLPITPLPRLPEVTVSEFGGVRALHLDSIWVQGAMRKSKPLHLELEYVQRMMAPLLWQAVGTWREGQAVQLGLGAAALTKFCHQVLGRPTVAVERHPGVLAACRQWFALPPDGAGLRVELQDADAWVRDPSRAGTVRLLHVDLYDEEAAAPVLDSADFYAACRELLSPDGAMAVNLFGRRASFDGSCQRLLQAFGPGHVWRLAATKEGNTVVVCTRETPLPDKAELKRRATNMDLALGLPAVRWLRGLKAVTHDPA